MTVEDRRWRGETLEARVAARRTRLIDAATSLMGDGGSTAVTMRAVCRAAELSPRYFYESFADTDALVAAVYDECNTRLGDRIAAAFDRAGGDLVADVRAAVAAAAAFFREDAGRVRILLREPMTDAVLRARRAGGAQSVVAAVAGAVESSVPDAVRVDRSRVAIAASALSGAFTFLILDWIDGRLDADEDALVEHATALAVAEIAAALH